MTWQDDARPDLGCEDCNVLMDALREAERQCRAVEHERTRKGLTFTKDGSDAAYLEEHDYAQMLKTLEHRRNCALEVLLKHQKFEHPT